MKRFSCGVVFILKLSFVKILSVEISGMFSKRCMRNIRVCHKVISHLFFQRLQRYGQCVMYETVKLDLSLQEFYIGEWGKKGSAPEQKFLSMNDLQFIYDRSKKLELRCRTK